MTLAASTNKVIDKDRVKMGSCVAKLAVVVSNLKAQSEQDQSHTESPTAQLT